MSHEHAGPAKCLDDTLDIRITGVAGNLIYKYRGGWGPRDIRPVNVDPDQAAFPAALAAAWQA